TLNTPDAGNVPGARQYTASWKSGGKLYLFGGRVVTSAGSGNNNDLWSYDLATGNWTWLKGSNVIMHTGVYGTIDVPDAANKPGGRYGSARWESGGKLYLFGGEGYTNLTTGYLSDLWEYDPATTNWKWLKGSNTPNEAGTYGTINTPAVANTPSARLFSTTWQVAGKLYLFGGQTLTGFHNDLWMYDIATRNWTWLKGSNSINQAGTYGTLNTPNTGNTPGARQDGLGWVAGGKLYLFGGLSTTGNNNDLWMFDPASGNWTWIKGSNAVNQTGTYGTVTVPNAANTPGARRLSANWEYNGKLYLFGGAGYAASGTGSLNDLWAYDIAAGEWAWIKGSNAANQVSTYGTLNTPAVTNIPGARQQSAYWQSNGKLYLLGGFGYDASISGSLNDLWVYDTGTGNWAWVKGSNTRNAIGSYGIVNVPEAANNPGARYNAVSWAIGYKAYFFGGRGYGVNADNNNYRGDLWSYSIPIPVPSITSFTPSSGAAGTLVTITGTSLDDPTTITIGGTPAIIVSNNGTQLVAMVMSGAVTGAISVTTANGTATSSGNFTLTTTNAPNTLVGSKFTRTSVGFSEQFGNAIALSADGKTAVIASPGHNSSQGGVTVFVKSGNTWTQQGNILAETGWRTQGNSVAISADGNTIISGANQTDNNVGTAFIYVRSNGIWTLQQKVSPSTWIDNFGVYFGASAALSADGNS
ncbi:MAG: hypothetical protein EOP51_25675, partial [Sphingobacteriales bacterium]